MAGREKEIDSSSLISGWLKSLEMFNVRGLLLLCKDNLCKEQINSSPSANLQIIEYLENKLGKALTIEGALRDSRIDDYLGTERSFVIFDAAEKFDANTFCALSGTIKGGGVFAILLSKSDFETKRHSIHTAETADVFSQLVQSTNNCLLQRFLNASKSNPYAAIFYDGDFIASSQANLTNTKHLEMDAPRVQDYSEQQAVVEHIVKVSTGHSRRPLVLTADRGRGKSAALGIAASKLMTGQSVRIIITAPKISALDSVFYHLVAELKSKGVHFESSRSRTGRLKSITTDNGSKLEFLPVDKIIREKPLCQTLMIDEAAAISVNALRELNLRYNRIVFSTTVHGYEGSGQGFDIRFKKYLLAKRPQTRFANLTKAIRWAKNDYLEKHVFDSFLLNSKLPETPVNFDSNTSGLKLVQVTRSNLLNDELALNGIFALLVNAHYQTRPADLQRLLTDKSLKIYTLVKEFNILGVCLINCEGALSDKECDQISNRTAQIQGHLLPQSIISRYGFTQFGKFKTARIMRIAIHPRLQSRGLGSKFISLIKDKIRNEFDFVGASFGATVEVSRFWLNNGFESIGFGTAKDSASGDLNLEVLCPLNGEIDSLLDSIRSRFARLFQFNLNKIYSSLSPQLTNLVLTSIFKDTDSLFSTEELSEIQRFCSGQTAVSQVGDILSDFFIKNSDSVSEVLTLDERELIVAYLFKNWSEELTAQHFNLTGKKEIQKKLRALFSRLLENN